MRRWFGKDEATDRYIVEHFSSDLNKARKGKYSNWTQNPRSMLALIVILDQFSRVIYRGSPKAFDTDLQCLEHALLAIKEGFDQELTLAERIFLYLPLEHAENLAVQKKSVGFFTELVEEARAQDPQNVPYLESTLEWAKKHYKIIEEFERFPHRNAALGRRSTSRELEFLEQPGSSF